MRAVCALGAAGLLLIVAGCGGRGRGKESAESAGGYTTSENRNAESVQGGVVPVSLEVSDFLFPDDIPEQPRTGCVPSREPLKRWSKAQIQRFWVPVDVLVENVLRRRSDEAMERLFSSAEEGTDRKR